MKNKPLLYFFICLLILVGALFSYAKGHSKLDLDVNELEATVIALNNETVTVQDAENIIYRINLKNVSFELGDRIILEYTGLIDKNNLDQDIEVIEYRKTEVNDQEEDQTKSEISAELDDEGMFKDFYVMADRMLKTMSLEEKIGQLLLVRYPDNGPDELVKYQFGGFVFYGNDFKDYDKVDVQKRSEELQQIAKIPLLMAVDEEGGKVVRISSNPKLVATPFKSSQELYELGGFDAIKEDTIEKSKILASLGINLNLAPVVDVTTSEDDYIYSRSFGQDSQKTSTYAKTVIEASKKGDVSYTLKHFPGYASNKDTHTGVSQDTRTYKEILDNDLPPFEAGIQAGAEAVLVSHNIVTSIDKDNPTSLSPSIHNLLRNTLNFTGVIITDDIDMDALNDVGDRGVKALLAGNDLIIVTDYKTIYDEIYQAVKNKQLAESVIDKKVFKILAWKHYMGLMLDHYKG